MEIKRRGSERDHGPMSTVLSPSSAVWDSDTKSVKLTAYFVRDFNATTRHDWCVSVTLDEIVAMLNAAARTVGGADATTVVTSLNQSLPAMLRLATECSIQLLSRAESEQTDDNDLCDDAEPGHGDAS
jgi:hypothetical protein